MYVCSEELGVKVGVHQGSVLSPLLFILVLEVLSCEFKIGTSWICSKFVVNCLDDIYKFVVSYQKRLSRLKRDRNLTIFLS